MTAENTVSPGTERTAAESLSVVAAGAGRLVRRWPGLMAIPVSYGIAAAALYDVSYAWILSAVIAGGVGVVWYLSPLRQIEARRRARVSLQHARRAGDGRGRGSDSA
jgi:hypothetical protein